MIKRLLELDKKLSEAIYNQSAKGIFSKKLLYRLTFGYGVIPLIVVVILLSNNLVQVILTIGISMMIFFIGFENYLKRFLKRKRPVYSILKSYSFPSTHALSTMTLTVFFLLNLNHYIIYLSLLIILYTFLIGLSRVYLGFHYLSDVLGGWLIGMCLGIIISLAYIWIL